ncbi:unnamed protein product [Trifolium pratense]|uniref:Uncharacterized protein n=1 Tax=Trifolium pratense TaxID=57577 RepID=A0ACB0K947_TRIPR|nr:unnamed protein product [Trifolium pratense]
MNPSTLNSSQTHPSILLPSLSPLRTQRRRFRVSLPRCSSDTNNPTSSSSPPPPPKRPVKELNGVEILVDKLPLPARLATSAVIVAGAVAAGYGLGSRFGGSRNAALGGAVAVGVAGGAAAYAMNAIAPQVAAVSLNNYVAGFDDPSKLKKEDIEVIANKYGVSKQDEAFKAEICDIYSEYVFSVIPPGGEELKGDEVDRIANFKNSLGLDDPDAAAVHMEIGRKLFRQRLEVGDREADVEQRRAFQKLIYVSNIVFGDASSFLLPWKRVFKVTESQVEVAIRDNAQRLYVSKLKSVGRDIDLGILVTLRETQRLCRLSDELAENLFREHVRKLVEENISVALRILKSRTRAATEVSQVVEELNKVLAFNDLLISFKNHSDIDRLARGVGPVSLVGGEYDGDRKMEDLKLLYRAYLSDALSSGRMEDNKLAALNKLKNVFGLGNRESEAISHDITSKVYRKRLGQTVSSGELEMADSKAAFLQNLCDELHFDPQKASELHEEIYRQKLQLCVADGELNDEDVAALLKLRVMLCVPQQTVEAAHADICGSLFEKIVEDAIASGVDGYDDVAKKSVRKAAHGLRLTKETVLSIASKADIKGESADVSTEEPVKEDITEIEEGEWGSLQTLRKIRPDKELIEKMGKPGQTEITLKDVLPEKDRTDLYKTFLTYCLTGDVVNIPFGAQITKKKDDTEYLYLNQLGGILGLTGKEIMDVHRGLAEKAFRQQAEVLLADGQLTKARVEQLGKMQKEIGLSQEYAQKIIKNITTTKMASAIETAVTQGKLNMKQIRELKESNVDLDSMVSVSLREMLFKKTIGDIFSSGTGEFDAEEVYEKIPLDLNINKEKARGVVRDLAKSRLSNSLIQAVALLRQRNHKGVVSSLNNLLACDKAVPSQTLPWEVSEELSDLYTIYLKSDPSPEKLNRLQYLLGINDSTAAALRDSGDRLLNTAEEEEFVF